MDIYVAILVCVIAGIVWTTRTAYRFRRRRTVAAFVSGGWFSVFIGVLLGSSGFDLIARESVVQTVPLVAVTLSAIGFMVGFQLRLPVLREVPVGMYRAVVVDVILTALLAGGIGLAGLRIWLPEATTAELWLPMAFIIAASLGWSLETRSLGSNLQPQTTMFVRVTGALLTVAAVLLFGLASKAVERDASGVLQFGFDRAMLKLLYSFALASVVGFVGRSMIGLAADRPGHQLAVFIGLIAFTAGSAKQLDTSPLLSSMLAGVVMANLRAPGVRKFEAFIGQAEHAISVFFGVLVGILMHISWELTPLVFGIALFAGRALAKPATIRVSGAERANAATDPGGIARTRLAFATIRQNPIMLAIGVSLILIEPSIFHKELVTILVLAGVLCEIQVSLVLRHSRIDRPDGQAEAVTT